MMLSKPECGWTTFAMGETKCSLSYLTNVPMDWLNEAIHGLETLRPFTVHGYLEPGRMLCTVSYWNCYLIFEDDGKSPLSTDELSQEIIPISMLDFCKQLYDDILENIGQWRDWSVSYAEKNKNLQEKLDKLQKLIIAKENCFNEGHCFI